MKLRWAVSLAVGIAAVGAGCSAFSADISGLVVMVHPLQPTLTSIVPPDAGPGAPVTITGADFGASCNCNPDLTFDGSLATQVNRKDDRSMTVTVPDGAQSGMVWFKVGGGSSNKLPFIVLRSLAISPGDTNLLQSRTLALHVSAVDTSGATVSGPDVNWAVQGKGISVSSQGLVTPSGLGDATVVASSGKVTTQVKIHVFQITGIALNQSSLNLNAPPPSGPAASGYVTSGQLDATITASDQLAHAVVWSSSNPALVTVSSAGNVSAVAGAAPGTAIVSAASADDPSYVAKATITVTTDAGLQLGVN